MAELSFREALVASAAELGHGPDAFRPLDDAEAADVAAAVELAFGNAANGAMVGWWHSDRPCPMPTSSRCFREGGGWRHLAAVAPGPAAPVWLLAENWFRGQPPLFAFACTAGVGQAVLGNTHGFEYIVCGGGNSTGYSPRIITTACRSPGAGRSSGCCESKTPNPPA